MKTNLDIIKDLYQHFSERNTGAIHELFAVNISWQQMKGFPNGGCYIGADAIFKNVFTGFSENWTNWKADIDEFIVAEDSIFAIGNYIGIYNKTQKHLQAAFVHHYILDQGKVTQFKQYTDTKLVAEAMS